MRAAKADARIADPTQTAARIGDVVQLTSLALNAVTIEAARERPTAAVAQQVKALAAQPLGTSPWEPAPARPPAGEAGPFRSDRRFDEASIARRDDAPIRVKFRYFRCFSRPKSHKCPAKTRPGSCHMTVM